MNSYFPYSTPLVAPQRPLPSRVRRAGVGMPGPLPSLLRFGPVAPPQVGGSRFTGGQVAQPQTSMTHPQAAQGFTPPHFNPSNPTAPSLAPFVSTPQGGQPTGPVLSMLATNTGATPSMQPPRPAPSPVSLDALVSQRGYQPVPQLDFGSPNRQVSTTPNPTGLPDTYEGHLPTPHPAGSLNLLLTLLAASGQRLNNQNRYAA